MIVYNIGTRFFAKKEDANKMRIRLGWDKSQIYKIRIESREQLAGFLNGLCNVTHNSSFGFPPELFGKRPLDICGCTPATFCANCKQPASLCDCEVFTATISKTHPPSRTS